MNATKLQGLNKNASINGFPNLTQLIAMIESLFSKVGHQIFAKTIIINNIGGHINSLQLSYLTI